MKKPNLGQKQTCKKCGARFFDLNKNPAVCLKCGETFKITKSKNKRTAATPTEAVAAVPAGETSPPVAADAPEAATNDGDSELAAAGQDGDDDLEAELEDDSDDDDLMEDTSDIGEDTDDMSEVLDHVDDGVGDK